MTQLLTKALLITLGWFFVILGIIGAFLPILPTTVFLIIALFLFARSSPRFHQMLLDNRYFGPGLREWEQHRTIKRQTKRKATVLIIITFAISIALLYERLALQIMLVAIASLLLIYLWNLNETAEATSTED